MLKFRLLKSDLKGVEEQLKRLNGLLETYLTSLGVRIPSGSSSTSQNKEVEEIEVSYVDEESDALREYAEKLGYLAKKDVEEEKEEELS